MPSERDINHHQYQYVGALPTAEFIAPYMSVVCNLVKLELGPLEAFKCFNSILSKRTPVFAKLERQHRLFSQ